MRTHLFSGQAGFSLLETLLAAAVTSVILYGGAAVMSGTVKQEKKTSVQSLLDQEFAAGAQIAANAAKLSPYVRPSLLADCLRKDQNLRVGTDCSSFGAWQTYPSVTGGGEPKFNTAFDLLGPCAPGGANCLVRRQMRYRWLCSANECTGLETEVRVTPLGPAAQTAQERLTTVALDRRQFFARAEILFHCDLSSLSLRRVDYDQLVDECRGYGASTCGTPHRRFNPFDASEDCQDELNRGCDYGFAASGLNNPSAECRGLPGGRTVAGGSTTTAPATYTPGDAGIHVTNTQTVVATITSSSTQTDTAAPTCVETVTLPGAGYYRIPAGTIFHFNGESFCGFSSPEHLRNYAGGTNPPSMNVAEMPHCLRYEGACADPGPGDGHWVIQRNDWSPSPPYEDCGPTTGSDPYWGQPCPRGRTCRYWNMSGHWDIMQCG